VPAEGFAHLRGRGRGRQRRREHHRRRGAQRQRLRRRSGLDNAGRTRDAQPHWAAARGGSVKNSDLLLAANTLWVVVAAVLVMFTQAGFAFLDAGLARMLDVPDLAGKDALVFGACSLLDWAGGFGVPFADRKRRSGTSASCT